MIQLGTILRAVSEVYGARESVLRSPCRYQEVAHARFAFMLLAKVEGYSFPRIGNYIDRHHTSIIHGARRAREMAMEREDFALQLADAIEALDAIRARDLTRIKAVRERLVA